MLRKFLLISSLFVAAYGQGQLTILQSPPSLDFTGSDKLEGESVGDVFAASLGYSVEHSSDWAGLYVNDPFNTSRAVIAVVVDGISRMNIISASKASYETTGSGSQESLDSLLYRVPSSVDFDLSQGLDGIEQYTTLFGNLIPVQINVPTLNPELYPEDKLFLEQIGAITALANTLPSVQGLPTLLTIRMSLAPLIKAHSLSSPAVTDALKQLSKAITLLSEAAQTSYDESVVVAVVAVNDAVHIRKKREIIGEPFDRETINLAKNYDNSYPVMFNIILWFGVVMTFSLLAISYTIGYMDPGRDSIIYRMTSTRMKKDN